MNVTGPANVIEFLLGTVQKGFGFLLLFTLTIPERSSLPQIVVVREVSACSREFLESQHGSYERKI